MPREPENRESARDRALALIKQQPRAEGQGVVEWLNRLCQVLASEIQVPAVTVIVGPPAGANSAVVAANESIRRRHAETDFSVGEGPSMDAWTHGRPVLVPELGGPNDGNWPGYTSAATAAGIRATFAFPLQIGAARIGILAAYSDQPRQLTRPELDICLTMAELATQQLLDENSSTPGGHIDPDLHEPVSFRDEIYQAQGMVAVALDIALADALSRMRAHAFESGRDLIDVAVDIVHNDLQLDGAFHDTRDCQHGNTEDDQDERD